MESAVPADTTCLEYVREHRAEEEVSCPHCGQRDVLLKGTTGKDAQQYYCRACQSYFNELTGTVFAGQRLCLGEMFFIIWQMDRRSITDITNELNRTYKTVLEFVHKVREHDQSDRIVQAIQDEWHVERQ